MSATTEGSPIYELRSEAASCKALRDDFALDLKVEEARAIERYIVAHDNDPKCLGSNEELRKQKMLIVLDEDAAVHKARAALRGAEFALAEAEARIDAWVDGRRREREALQRETNQAMLGAPLVEMRS